MNKIRVNGEPENVWKTRDLILDTFKDLQFVEEGHKYFLHGKELPSVSAVTHQFARPFDEISISESYAKKHGKTPEFWRTQWKYKNLIATTSGTQVHLYGECMTYLRMGHPELIPEEMKKFYILDKGWLIPTRPKEEAIVKYFSEMYQYDFPVLAETKVFNNFNPNVPKMRTDYCGTFDILYYRYVPENPAQSGYIIRDFKTNSELVKDYSRKHNKTCLEPFTDLPDEPLSMYTLQLSCYQIPLMDLGINIIGREIIWLKEDKTYEVIQLPDITQKLREVL
jgi:hypothetical protein